MAAIETQLPCGNDGVCMRCKAKPPSEETLKCRTCDTDWHVPCLTSPLESLASTLGWKCPDCPDDDVDAADPDPAPVSGVNGDSRLVAAIRAIQADGSLTDAEKAKKRQQLMSSKAGGGDDDEEKEENTVLASLNCSICFQLPERPVTTPCGHNFCLKCFEKWTGQGKFTCANCRTPIPKKTAQNPRINLTLVTAIRLAKNSKCDAVSTTTAKIHHFISNKDRPDKAFTTERAKKTGKANAASGKIYVTIPPDHFGPIPAENDPVRNKGVSVGDFWEDRLECRQWGAHFPHVAGIAGQSDYGAQSVALSGGYKDDEDHGEWFLYTGSGGRDLSGNKRTNKNQSFDQKFDKFNEALRKSCKMGYPVRVVRSHKEKRSAYAPEDKGVRYDGVYRIEKCWRKIGIQGSFKVCRYLFVRCDNDPAPWTSDEHGDRPRALPDIPELKKATDLYVRTENPSWDFDEGDGRWKWMKPPPASRKSIDALNPKERKNTRKGRKTARTTRDKILKGFGCQICRKVMSFPVTTPCGHNFCKACLEGKFIGITPMRERTRGGRTLRAQKNMKSCPCCSNDLSEFLENPQVNRDLMEMIENLKKEEEEPVVGENTTESNSSSENTDASAEDEEESQVVSEAEPPTKKMKLDTATLSALL